MRSAIYAAHFPYWPLYPSLNKDASTAPTLLQTYMLGSVEPEALEEFAAAVSVGVWTQYLYVAQREREAKEWNAKFEASLEERMREHKREWRSPFRFLA